MSSVVFFRKDLFFSPSDPGQHTVPTFVSKGSFKKGSEKGRFKKGSIVARGPGRTLPSQAVKIAMICEANDEYNCHEYRSARWYLMSGEYYTVGGALFTPRPCTEMARVISHVAASLDLLDWLGDALPF